MVQDPRDQFVGVRLFANAVELMSQCNDLGLHCASRWKSVGKKLNSIITMAFMVPDPFQQQRQLVITDEAAPEKGQEYQAVRVFDNDRQAGNQVAV